MSYNLNILSAGSVYDRAAVKQLVEKSLQNKDADCDRGRAAFSTFALALKFTRQSRICVSAFFADKCASGLRSHPDA